MNAVLMELKGVLTYLLNSKNVDLRKKGLEFAMELLSELEMDFTKAEKALKAELKGDKKTASKIVEDILNDIDKEEYKR